MKPLLNMALHVLIFLSVLLCSTSAFQQPGGWIPPSTPIQHRVRSAEPPTTSLRTLYPALESYRNGTIAVDSIHTLYYQEYGNPEGMPALFLHGGPGAGCFPNHARFFDPEKYRIVLIDQRGSGRSTPKGEVRNNTLLHLVQDCETLREYLKIKQWGVVLGGSWGSTLALAYAQEHPTSLEALILRGVCLLRRKEVDWLFGGNSGNNGMASLHPKSFGKFGKAVGVEIDDEKPNRQALHAHYDRLMSDDPVIRSEAARSWMWWEMGVGSSSKKDDDKETTNKPVVVVVGRPMEDDRRAWCFANAQDQVLVMKDSPIRYKEQLRKHPTASESDHDISKLRPFRPASSGEPFNETAHDAASKFVPAQAMLTCFYSVNSEYCLNGIDLLDPQRMKSLESIPCIAVHGGQDPICPIDSALDLAKAYPKMELRIPSASGHSMYDEHITNELVAATDHFGMDNRLSKANRREADNVGS